MGLLAQGSKLHNRDIFSSHEISDISHILKGYLSSQTQQWMPRLPENTHRICWKPKSSRRQTSMICNMQANFKALFRH